MHLKTYSVTVGIPAHNEEQNIQTILHTLIEQTSAFYHLEKILVICDGCTDQTETLAREVATTYPIISIINDNERLGKSERLNQIYESAATDIIITIDADIMLGNAYVLDEIVRHFDDKAIALVTGNWQPIKGESFTEHMINVWHAFWYEVRHDYQDGDTIYNISGALLAVRTSFAKTIHFPKGLIANSQFLYLAAKTKKYNFYFAKEALVYYYSPNNLKDYLLTLNRYSMDHQTYISFFGVGIEEKYYIPRKRKIAALIKTFFHSPFFLSYSVIFQLWYRTMKHRSSAAPLREGLWQRVSSTKRVLPTFP